MPTTENQSDNLVSQDRSSQENRLGTGSIPRLLLSLAAPAITAQIINVLYNMVDRMYIGHIEGIGDVALTGVGVTMPLIMCVSAFAALVSMGGAPRASIMMGRQRKDTAEQILGGCTVMLVIVALILTAVLLLFGRPLLMAFGASDNTIGYALDYMNIYACGTIFVQLALGLNAFISAQGYARTSMLSVLIGAVCNIILDPIMIFGYLGFPAMGVKGAALATIISQAISSAWVVIFLCSRRSFLRIRLKNLRLRADILLPCLALGVSPFIMQFTESIITVCFNVSLQKYGGDLAVGAMTILSSVMQFSMLPLQGLTQGAQPIVSYNYGAGQLSRVKKTFQLTLISALVYSTVLWAISEFAPQVFVFIFTDQAALGEYAARVMRIYMATSLVFGAQIACQQTFIALGNAKASLFLALLRKVFLLIPFIFILPLFFSGNEAKTLAVFLAEPVADLIAVCTTVTMFTISFRRLLKNAEH